MRLYGKGRTGRPKEVSVFAKRKKVTEIEASAWDAIEKEVLTDKLTRQTISGENGTIARFIIRQGGFAPPHEHDSEEYCLVMSGAVTFTVDEKEIVGREGEIVIIPPDTTHAVRALEDSVILEFFAPRRDDWLRGEDRYLRKQSADDRVMSGDNR